MCAALTGREKRQAVKQIRESKILATGNHRISQYNPLFKKPQNKLGMKTQNKIGMTLKSTKTTQMARSGDNLPSTTGTNDRATPKSTVATSPRAA